MSNIVTFLVIVECNGQPEEQVSLQSTADQEVPHPDVLPEQSTGDFDFNEFFNLEKTMPGLASVSTGVHWGIVWLKGVKITSTPLALLLFVYQVVETDL